ncbi:MAG: choice-of-anchor J domain-containing protein [Bacteroidales bacterium]|nr:choice-of-anchor J domain-containing protein [Bacteroidales bacterium]
MIKSVFFTIMMVVSISGFSQVFLLQEFFNDPVKLPSTWTTIDKDGDGHNWHINIAGSEVFAVSDSWMSGVAGALTPENYLVSPKINLTGINGTVKLRYTIQIPDPVSVEEHYKVAVSTTGNKVADFKDIVLEETCTEADYYENLPAWKERWVDLTPYIGQNIYLAWCHFNCTNMYQIMLDSIQVSSLTNVSLTNCDQAQVTMYPNPVKDKLLITGSFENAQLQLFAADGRQVYQSNKVTKQAELNVSCLENGFYILKINSQKGVITKRVNISH